MIAHTRLHRWCCHAQCFGESGKNCSAYNGAQPRVEPVPTDGQMNRTFVSSDAARIIDVALEPLLAYDC
jgi:hypothetical protein